MCVCACVRGYMRAYMRVSEREMGEGGGEIDACMRRHHNFLLFLSHD